MKRSELVELLRNQFDYMELSSDKDAMFNWESSRPINTAELNQVIEFFEKYMLPPDNGKEAYDVLDYRYKCLKWDEE